jgi:hypothetical protein
VIDNELKDEKNKEYTGLEEKQEIVTEYQRLIRESEKRERGGSQEKMVLATFSG